MDFAVIRGNALLMGFGALYSDLTFWEYTVFHDAWMEANRREGEGGPKVEAPSRDDALAWFGSDG